MTGSAEVENRYRTSLWHGLLGARSQEARVGDAFAIVRRAMADGAWESTVADAFSEVCVSKESSAATAAGDCAHTMQHRHGREPWMVPVSDPRARWR